MSNIRKWTSEEIELLKIEYPNLNHSRRDLEKIFNRSWNGINIKASQLKIKRINQGSKSKISDFDRFMAKVNKNSNKFYDGTECHDWIACRDKDSGYGQFGVNYKAILVHRWIYEYYHGPIGPELVVDHMCRNRSCVNVLHLRIVIRGVNATENSNSPTALNAQKERCPKCNGEYQYDRRNFRVCRKCQREYSKRYDQSHKKS